MFGIRVIPSQIHEWCLIQMGTKHCVTRMHCLENKSVSLHRHTFMSPGGWQISHIILTYITHKGTATIYSLFPTWYTAFLSTYNICYPLSSTCFRPHRPIIRRSKLYMQPMVFSPSADVFVVQPLRKDSTGRTTKTSAEGENTIGCMYNLDLLMMGLWGLKHVEERG